MIQSIEDGRRKAGDRSIADKIIKRLHDLDKTVENNQGRWAWELLQNAKDSIAEDDHKTVSVQIELDEDSVEFRHNGTHFTDQDVIGLISQISSKEVEEGQQTKKTGRFGTGFLTTHLLSRVIKIKGILEAADKSFHKFEFLLDRQGKTTTQLMPRIAKSWNDFGKSIKEINYIYDKHQFYTSFCYQLQTEEQRRIAKVGVEEFSKFIPLVLTFVTKISRVEIIDNTTKNVAIFETNKELRDSLIVPISKTENGEKTDILILCASNDRVAIAAEVEKTERGYSVKNIEDFPKLFCDFPLIVTKGFYFPTIVNSFFFNPQTERDGIWLKGSDDIEVEENQELLKSAVELYKDLVSQVADGDFFALYNLAETRMPSTDERYFDKEWYEEFIQRPIREFIYSAKIVELEDETSEKKAIKELWFPRKSFTEEIQKKIWQFTFDLAPNRVCKRKHLHNWCNISWDDWKTINYQALVNALAGREKIHKLSQDLRKTEENTFDWLNSLGNFLLEDDSNIALLEKTAIIPNLNGVFKKKIDLYVDEIQDDELVCILNLLGENWRDILLHNDVNFLRGSIRVKGKKDIAVKITEDLNKALKKPSYNNDENIVKAISLLSEWFENNSEQGKELFSELYRKRAEIFMNTIRDKESLYKVMRTCTDLSKLAEVAKAVEDDSKIIEKIQELKELTNLLEEFKADDISDLKSMLRLAQSVLADDSNKIEITQKTLLSLGVTSIDELEEALRDKGIAAKFTHTSTPTIEMFLVVQRLIDRAKNNVIKYLQSLKDYDCTDLEELATTVIGGIKKDGLPIYIVVRPSDNKEVIVYYSSEKDILDFANAELWIDNGADEPRHLTLGKILKTTGINRIPV